MPSTLQALGIVLLAVLPGALATLAYERHRPGRTVDSAERVVRFVGVTLLVSPIAFLLAYPVWREVLHRPALAADGRRIYVNDLANGDASKWWSLVVVAYVVIPVLLGLLAGAVVKAYVEQKPERIKRSLGANLTAWDVIFLEGGPIVIAARLRSDVWVAGLFGSRSYASAPAVKNKELLLEEEYEVDADGRVDRDADGVPVPKGGSVLICWSDVEVFNVYAI
jgi:hypothetical protein